MTARFCMFLFGGILAQSQGSVIYIWYISICLRLSLLFKMFCSEKIKDDIDDTRAT